MPFRWKRHKAIHAHQFPSSPFFPPASSYTETGALLSRGSIPLPGSRSHSPNFSESSHPKLHPPPPLSSMSTPHPYFKCSGLCHLKEGHPQPYFPRALPCCLLSTNTLPLWVCSHSQPVFIITPLHSDFCIHASANTVISKSFHVIK